MPPMPQDTPPCLAPFLRDQVDAQASATTLDRYEEAACSHRTHNRRIDYQPVLGIFKSQTKHYLRLHYLGPVNSVEEGIMNPARMSPSR